MRKAGSAGLPYAVSVNFKVSSTKEQSQNAKFLFQLHSTAAS